MTLEEAKKEILGMSMGAIGEGGMNPLKEGISYDGLIRTYDDILAILAKVDTEPAPKDKMTLTELARELRKIFKFKYLTVRPAFRRDSYDNIDEYYGNAIELWDRKPCFLSDEGSWIDIFSYGEPTGEPTGELSKECLHSDSLVTYLVLDLPRSIEEMLEDGDFSEYEKCIVEV